MVELLEAIRRTGSLRVAASELQMSYMHAWGLVKTMNGAFRDPLVELSRGGAARGGARLSVLGGEVLALYREMETEALRAVATRWKRLKRLLS
jgi:molybdate transport system regulatory protein